MASRRVAVLQKVTYAPVVDNMQTIGRWLMQVIIYGQSNATPTGWPPGWPDEKIGVTQTTVLRLIRLKQLPATQACVSAPWILRSADVERCVAERNHPTTPPTVDSAQLTLEIS